MNSINNKVCKSCKNKKYLRYISTQECSVCYHKRYREKKGKVLKEKKKEYYSKNRKHIIDKVKKWSQENREKTRRNSQTSHKRYPLKNKARNISSDRIRRGKLIRLPCTVCGKKNAQAHHLDYTQPLLIRWLCSAHHALEHKRNG